MTKVLPLHEEETPHHFSITGESLDPSRECVTFSDLAKVFIVLQAYVVVWVARSTCPSNLLGASLFFILFLAGHSLELVYVH